MNAAPEHRHPESTLAVVLRYGTTVSYVVIAAGIAAALVLPRLGTASASTSGAEAAHVPGLGEFIARVGIGLLILIPTLRVLLMMIFFVRQRDYQFAGVAAVVLLIILCGFVLGLSVPSAG